MYQKQNYWKNRNIPRIESPLLSRYFYKTVLLRESNINALSHLYDPNDLKSCKDLLNRHQQLKAEMTLWEQKIDELVSSGEEIAHEAHFDLKNIKDI